MRYFWEKELIHNLKEKIKKGGRIFLFLDYDGTLTSIRRIPELALLFPSTRKSLESLVSVPRVVMTIVSGRALTEITRLVNLDILNYVGNHGLEMRVGSSEYKLIQAKRIKERMSSLFRKIKGKTSRFSGILVENKGLTLSIHYRMVKEDCLPELKETVNSVVSPFKRDYELREGKKVLEIKPKTKRNKGWAVNKIIQQYRSPKKTRDLYLYFGDDLTDEDAFQLINSKRGYSILVDKKNECSKAHFYLKNPKEVHLFLSWLKKILTSNLRRKPWIT
jgi:trehalose 6-phosphate phosphatase